MIDLQQFGDPGALPDLPGCGRYKIVDDFSRWAAQAATRRAEVSGRQWDAHIRAVQIHTLYKLPSPVSAGAFNAWHHEKTAELCEHSAGP